MARVRITKDKPPKTPKEFRRILREAIEQSNPVDDLLQLAVELHNYEQEHGMTSAEFYSRYKRGELSDDGMHATIRWAMAYDHFLRVKEQVENALMREAVWREELEQIAA